MEWVEFEVHGELNTAQRYRLLDRVARAASRRSVRLLGFSVDTTVRLLLAGRPDPVGTTVAVTKMGTVQAAAHAGRALSLGETRRRRIFEPSRALVQLHRREGRCPLSDPWTSHRDLLGLRHAPFYDATAWHIDPRWVHVEAGGGALPIREAADLHPLDEVMKTAGAVLGVLPADRACFPLFVHLATRLGWEQKPIARALMVTPRRVRQLKARPARGLRAGLLSLADDRLRAP